MNHQNLLMEEILHQLRLVVYPHCLHGFLHPSWLGMGCLPSAVFHSSEMRLWSQAAQLQQGPGERGKHPPLGVAGR